MHKPFIALVALAAALISQPLFAQDGTGIGGTSLFIQDTPTGFGNAIGGGQDSAGGSEIDQVFGDFNVGTGILSLGITGNLEGNFNKFFIFIDGVAGGENTLLNDNVDGGFGEINNLAGLVFDSGFTPDHGIRVEVGGGFYGVRGFDLINNTAFDIATGGGPGDLPLTAAGGVNGVTFGWDNSNILGVDTMSAAGAATATTGWEFEIDLNQFLGGITQDIGVSGFITDGGGNFISNQVIGGLGGAGNLGAGSGVDFNNFAGNQFVVIQVPEPGALGLLALGSIVALARRRK